LINKKFERPSDSCKFAPFNTDDKSPGEQTNMAAILSPLSSKQTSSARTFPLSCTSRTKNPFLQSSTIRSPLSLSLVSDAHHAGDICYKRGLVRLQADGVGKKAYCFAVRSFWSLLSRKRQLRFPNAFDLPMACIPWKKQASEDAQRFVQNTKHLSAEYDRP